jgi:hypothetical protein
MTMAIDHRSRRRWEPDRASTSSALVEQLVDAQYRQQECALTAKNDTLTAQISSVSELKSSDHRDSTAR